jgi:hypothetical protein
MPQLGESIAEGTIVKWLKKPGDAVKKDENILLISTDKVEAEIPAPTSGPLVSIAVAEGQTVNVGTVLVSHKVDRYMHRLSPHSHDVTVRWTGRADLECVLLLGCSYWGHGFLSVAGVTGTMRALAGLTTLARVVPRVVSVACCAFLVAVDAFTLWRFAVVNVWGHCVPFRSHQQRSYRWTPEGVSTCQIGSARS